MVHHHDAVRHGEGLFLVVGDHDRGHPEPPLELLDLVAEVHAHLRVERGERLVQEQEAGRGGERAGEGDPLLLPARELRRVLGALLAHADHVEQLAHARRHLGLRGPRVLEPVGDVRGGGEVGKQGVGLEDDAEVPLGGGEGRDVAAGLLDAAARLDVEAGNRAQQGGLAAPRRTQDADELALRDRERHLPQCVGRFLARAVGLRDARDLEQLGHHAAVARHPRCHASTRRSTSRKTAFAR